MVKLSNQWWVEEVLSKNDTKTWIEGVGLWTYESRDEVKHLLENPEIVEKIKAIAKLKEKFLSNNMYLLDDLINLESLYNELCEKWINDQDIWVSMEMIIDLYTKVIVKYIEEIKKWEPTIKIKFDNIKKIINSLYEYWLNDEDIGICDNFIENTFILIKNDKAIEILQEIANLDLSIWKCDDSSDKWLCFSEDFADFWTKTQKLRDIWVSDKYIRFLYNKVEVNENIFSD